MPEAKVCSLRHNTSASGKYSLRPQTRCLVAGFFWNSCLRCSLRCRQPLPNLLAGAVPGTPARPLPPFLRSQRALQSTLAVAAALTLHHYSPSPSEHPPQ